MNEYKPDPLATIIALKLQELFGMIDDLTKRIEQLEKKEAKP